jgi:anti-sigma factor (TIGR02949 family)
MTCAEVRERLSAFTDDELDPVTSSEVARHVAGCTECARELAGLRALSERVRADVETHRAPAALRARLVRELAPTRATRRPPAVWRGLAMASAAAVLVVGGFVAGRLPLHPGGDAGFVHEAVAAHVRSLLPGHLSDVVSTDQHTVKPWFAGRIDFSPPVTDFVGDGFPLVGGRLDDLGGRPVAALVYMRGKHVINVFEWPTVGQRPGEDSSAPIARLNDERGYHVIHATGGGTTYWLVSDLNAGELGQLAGMLIGKRS